MEMCTYFFYRSGLKQSHDLSIYSFSILMIDYTPPTNLVGIVVTFGVSAAMEEIMMTSTSSHTKCTGKNLNNSEFGVAKYYQAV